MRHEVGRAYLVIVEGVVDCNIPLHSHPHRHEDGAGHGDGVERVEERGEEVDLQTLILLVHFLIFLDQIFLMIFLMVLVEVDEAVDEDNMKIEVLT